MYSKFSFFNSFLLAFSFFFFACSVENADEEIIFPNQSYTHNDSKESSISEFDFNYRLLSYYFFEAETKLEKPDYYIGLGEKNGYSEDYYEYPDIYNMYDMLGDPYTYYIGPFYLELYGNPFSVEETYKLGIDIEFIKMKDEKTATVITQIYPNSPAEKAKLQVADTILSVGNSIPGDIEGFLKLTSGKEGDSISLTVLRNKDTLQFNPNIFCYLQPTVSTSYQDSIAIIKIFEFAQESAAECSAENELESKTGTAWEFSNALKKTKGPIIIDLRGNTGGDVNESVQIANNFLANKEVSIIFKETDYDTIQNKQTVLFSYITATEDGLAKDRYVVFLADSMTASASEILLAAVSSNRKFPIVGVNTYGKGIGQYAYQTPASGYSVITSLVFLDKNREVYHDKGFVPDYEIADADKALEKAIELAKKGTEKRTKGYGTVSTEHFDISYLKKTSSKKTSKIKGAYIKKNF